MFEHYQKGNQIVPHPNHILRYADLHSANADLDYAIFNLRLISPIPVSPINQLPTQLSRNLRYYYGTIGDFQGSEFSLLAVWITAHHSVLQYAEYDNEKDGCRLLTEHGLCHGSSGGALVSNGHVMLCTLIH